MRPVPRLHQVAHEDNEGPLLALVGDELLWKAVILHEREEDGKVCDERDLGGNAHEGHLRARDTLYHGADVEPILLELPVEIQVHGVHPMMALVVCSLEPLPSPVFPRLELERIQVSQHVQDSSPRAV